MISKEKCILSFSGLRSKKALWENFTWMIAGWMFLIFSNAAATEIPLEIIEPSARTGTVNSFPVSVGIILQSGQVTSLPGGQVKDDLNQDIPFVATATNYWSGTDVKWLLLQFKASTNRQYRFVLGSGNTSGNDLATQNGNVIQVNTGLLAVQWTAGTGAWFDALTLNGTNMIQTVSLPQSFTLSYNGNNITTTRSNITHTLEQNNPETAIIRIESDILNGTTAVARQIIRMQFFRDESFIRIYHTFVWKIQNTEYKAKEISLRFKPALGTIQDVHIGLSDYTDSSITRTWNGNPIVACQNNVSSFTVTDNGQQVNSGTKLGGWIAMENGAGRGMAVCLRFPWQTYPKTLAAEDGQIRIGLWPDEASVMGFNYDDLMPEPLYSAPEWLTHSWSAGSGHAEHECGTNTYFMHTAEGAARTHELSLYFYDNASDRASGELNSLTQHPIAIRQDPVSAMSVKHMGFNLTYKDTANYPVIENAIETLGRLATHRQENLHDYGFWRFGMVRWMAGTSGLYRWIDGTQYGTQIIPWLLWMRGGGRNFFEDAQITSRYAMDVHVNHYNTRNVSAGYMESSAIAPFPFINQFCNKSIKTEFMGFDYHLTGYQRARDVQTEVKNGLLWAAANEGNPSSPAYRGQGRELFNISRSLADLYTETSDSSVLTHAAWWFNTTFNREYNSTLKVFRSPTIYLYPSIAYQIQVQGNSSGITNTLLDHMNALGIPGLPLGGFYNTDSVMLCPWAYEQSQNENYAKIAWDMARQIADRIPSHDWSNPPDLSDIMAFPVSGIYGSYLLPVLIGQAVARQRQYDNAHPVTTLRDTHIGLAPAQTGKHQVYFRPWHDGNVNLRISLKGRQNMLTGSVTASIRNSQNQEVGSLTINGSSYPTVTNNFYEIGCFDWEGTTTIQNATGGEIYGIDFSTTTPNTQDVCALVDSNEAQVVHRMPNMTWFDTNQYGDGGGTSAGKIYAMTTGTSVSMYLYHRYPIAARDAVTWELLYQSSLIPDATISFNVVPNRLIVVISKGYGHQMRFNSGVKGFLSTSPSNFFDPEAQSVVFADDFNSYSFDSQDTDRDPNAPAGLSPVLTITENAANLVTVSNTADQTLEIVADRQGVDEGVAATFTTQADGLLTMRNNIRFNDVTGNTALWLYVNGSGGHSFLMRARPGVTTGDSAGFHIWTRNSSGSTYSQTLIHEIQQNNWYQLVVQFDLFHKVTQISMKNLDSSATGQSARLLNVPFYSATAASISLLKWYSQAPEPFNVSLDKIKFSKD